MLTIRDDRRFLAPTVSRRTLATAVKVWDTDTRGVAFGPTVIAGVENFELVENDDRAAYKARQDAFIAA